MILMLTSAQLCSMPALEAIMIFQLSSLPATVRMMTIHLCHMIQSYYKQCDVMLLSEPCCDPLFCFSYYFLYNCYTHLALFPGSPRTRTYCKRPKAGWGLGTRLTFLVNKLFYTIFYTTAIHVRQYHKNTHCPHVRSSCSSLVPRRAWE